MRLDLFSPGDSVLLLGEGNFSFAVNLLKHKLPIFMVATCFERDMALEHQAESIHYLEENEVPVYLDIGATRIHEHRDIAAHKYSKVVFNFPHISGKKKKQQNIQEHRDLLLEMFKSARKVVDDEGQMLVSLCRGQGGTEADLPFTPYEQSWQIAEMGAHGDFILTGVEPYVPENFPEYKCHDADLSLNGALVHIFSKCPQLFPDEIDENVAEELLQMETVNIGGQYTSLPAFCHELYEKNPLRDPKSPAGFFQEMLLKELRDIKTTKKPVKTINDEDIPLSVDAEKGVPVGDEYDPNLRLRMTPLQILNDAIIALEDFNTDGYVFFPGMYFSDLTSRDFRGVSPASLEFLLLGRGAATLSYRFLFNLGKYFEKENMSLHLRPKNAKGAKMPHPRDTVEKTNHEDDLFKWHLGLEWAYVFEDESEPSCVVSHVYSIWYKDATMDAVIIHHDKLLEFFFGKFSWREVLSDRIKVKKFKNAPPEVRVRHPGMNPPDFIMELTIHLGEKPFEKEVVYRTLWEAAGYVIDQVDKLSDESSNVTLVIKYKSDDIPLYREKVSNIHQKIVCKMLSKVLGVYVS